MKPSFPKTLSAAKPYPAMVSAIFDTLSCKLIHLYVSCSLPSCLCIYPDLSLFPMMGTKKRAICAQQCTPSSNDYEH